MDTVPTEFYKRTLDVQDSYRFSVPMYRPCICLRSDLACLLIG